jgi:hypothetical protein
VEPAKGGVAPSFAVQPGAVIGDVNGTAVLALAAPGFASLSREQRLVAYWAAQAFAAGDPIAAEQAWRRNREIIRLLRGILSRTQVIPAALVARIRAYARAVYLNHGIHDLETGGKLLPPFTAADLRTAALAAQAAGANLGLAGTSLEYGLRALEGPLFDPRVDAQRPAAQGDRLERLPEVAENLERALTSASPPQHAVIEGLSAFFRAPDPDAERGAERAWAEAFGPVDFFAGFRDPAARKPLFGGMVGIADRDRTDVLEGLGRRPAEALFLLAAAGGSRPLRSFAVTVEGKTALFAAAQEAAARVRDDRVLLALTDPRVAEDVSRCAPELRFAELALRETSRTAAGGAVDEALADVGAHTLAPNAAAVLPEARCRQLWPSFAAARWLAAAAEDVDSDRHRAMLLEIGWFTAKGALAERRSSGHPFYTVPDAQRFATAAAELGDALRADAPDSPRVRELFDRSTAKIDPRLQQDVRARLSGLPLRVAVLPPRVEAVMQDGAVNDAQAAPVQDLDEQILRDWAQM